MDSEKSINSFKTKKNRLADYLLINYFLYRFFSNFSPLLLCKINVLDSLDVSDFKKNFLYSEILKF